MKKACVEVTQAFRDFSLLLVEAIASLGQKTRFLPYPSLSLRALPFLGPLAAYRGVDPGCHSSSLLTAYIDITR